MSDDRDILLEDNPFADPPKPYAMPSGRMGDAGPSAQADSPVPSGRLGDGPPLAGPVDLEAQTADENASILSRSSHPVVLVFHLLFRTAALAQYLLASLVSDNFVFVLVVEVLLLSFDFWTVKNVSGRILVGLRWWNDVREDGTSTWVYESRQSGRPVNPFDSKVFWISLYVFPLIWAILFILAFILIKWEWMFIPGAAFILSAANLWGYWNCDRDAQAQQVSGLAGGFGGGAFGMAGTLLRSGMSSLLTRRT